MRAHLLASLLLLSGLQINAQNRALDITHLTGGYYVYTTYNTYQGQRIGANGLYVVTEEGVVLIDSPWDTTQFQPLLDTIQKRHRKEVVLNLATHFHEDRTGGLTYYASLGIPTYTTVQTDALSRQRGMPRAQHLFSGDTVFTVGGYRFRAFHPGAGHTPDNIVVWFEGGDRVLYGGCLIKSTEDATLGNLGDADRTAYAETIKRLRRALLRPIFIIPGHNGWKSTRSLRHTHRLARALHK